MPVAAAPGADEAVRPTHRHQRRVASLLRSVPRVEFSETQILLKLNPIARHDTSGWDAVQNEAKFSWRTSEMNG